MRRTVRLTPQFVRKSSAAAVRWASFENGRLPADWGDRLLDRVATLAEFAEGYPLTDFGELITVQVRELAFGFSKRPTHRVFFVVEDDLITVLDIRHVAERPPVLSQLFG